MTWVILLVEMADFLAQSGGSASRLCADGKVDGRVLGEIVRARKKEDSREI